MLKYQPPGMGSELCFKASEYVSLWLAWMDGLDIDVNHYVAIDMNHP